MLMSISCTMRKDGYREEYMSVTLSGENMYHITGSDGYVTKETALASINDRLSAAKLDGYKNSVRISLQGTDNGELTSDVSSLIQLENVNGLLVSATRDGGVIYDSFS